MKPPLLRPVNQLDYACVPYPTTLERGERLQKPYPSVAVAGCGLCCICMTVEFMTGELLLIEKCVELSIKSGANVFGTDMERLGAAAAEAYGLRFETADSMDSLLKCLGEGGCAVVNVGRKNGIFSDGGHFLFAAGIAGYEEGTAKDGNGPDEEENGCQVEADAPKWIWLLDPSFTKQKYERPDRRKKVKLREPYILAPPEALEEEALERRPAYFLFYGKNIGNGSGGSIL